MKTKCDVYSRVVGYYRPVDSWNNGKKEEFKDRLEYEVIVQQTASPTLSRFDSPHVRVTLITTKTCPHCAQAKQVVEHMGDTVEAIFVDASTQTGLYVAKQFGVVTVPTALFMDSNGDVIAKVSGLDQIEQYVKSRPTVHG